jgi:transposase
MQKLPSISKVNALHKRMSMRAIGEMYGVSRQAVSQYVQLHGGKKSDHRIVFDRKRIEKFLREGKAVKDIAAEMDCYVESIQRIARELGFDVSPPPKPFHRHVSNKKWLQKRYCDWKWTIQDIATELKCSTGVIRDWLPRHNIKTRSPGRPRKGTPLPLHCKRPK